jgi:hypothetical protein
MVCNAREDSAQIRLGIDTVKLGRTNQVVDRGGTFAAGVRSGEQIVIVVRWLH